MNRRRLLLGGAGVVAVGAVLVAGVTLGGDLDGAVDALGTDYALVAVLGGCAVCLALLAVGHGDDVDQATVPDPEGAVSMAAPGDGFDERVRRWRTGVPVLGAEDRRAVRRRLRDAAVGVVRQTDHCDAGRAQKRVDDGTWTDDALAAAFLADGGADVGGADGAWLVALLNRETPFAHAARRTAEAVARRSERDSQVRER